MPFINGFVVRSSARAIPVKNFKVPGTSVSLPVRVDVAPLLIGFAAEFHRSVEPLTRGWNWGYAYRAVRGASSPSFHAAGIAIDLNAPRHALGKRGTFNARQVRTIRALCRKYGLRWGGDYRGRADEMHFEVIVPISQAHALVRKLQSKPPIAPAKPGTPGAGSPVLRIGASGAAVAVMQRHLAKVGYRIAADGKFGPGTQRIFVDFQVKHGLKPDGVCGPAAWAALRRYK